MNINAEQNFITIPPNKKNGCAEKLQTNIYNFTRSFYTNPEANFQQLSYCLETKLRKIFIATVSAFLRVDSPDKGYGNFISDSAFTEAIILFKQKLEIDNWKDDGASVKTYFSRIYWNKVRELIKKEKSLRNKHAGLAIVQNGTEASIPAEERQEQQISLALLEKALKRLTPEQAKIIKLRFVLGLPPREIVKLVGGTVARITKDIYNAKEELKKNLK